MSGLADTLHTANTWRQRKGALHALHYILRHWRDWFL